MAGITGQGTTYNLPNYVGELFSASAEDTPFLTAIGGLTGGISAGAPLYEWQTYDLRDADDTRQRKEGQDAPTGEARVRSVVRNVPEIHQETIGLSYTRQAAVNAHTTDGAKMVTIGGTTLPETELQWQIDQALKQVARDVNKAFLTGAYQDPANNTQPRKTRGLSTAITTNVVAGTGALTADLVLDTMQKVWERGGIQESETRTILVGGKLKRALTKLFIKDQGYKESTRNVGGVNLQTLETDFGSCNIMLDRSVPDNMLMVVSLEECAPFFLEIPGKGHFFMEPLAKNGAYDRIQLYGEIGLMYGCEAHHGLLKLT